MSLKDKKNEIINLLGLAECKLYELLPSDIPNRISDEAFSVIKYFDDIRKILQPSANAFFTGVTDGKHTQIGIYKHPRKSL